MIAIIASMVRVRFGRAVAVGLLAAAVIAVAVAAPAYLVRADRAMINTEAGAAPPNELTLTAQTDLDFTGAAIDPSFRTRVPAQLAAPWWNVTLSATSDIYLAPLGQPAAPEAGQATFVYREGYCAHLVLTAGRCPLGTREVLIGADAASHLHASPGSTLDMFPVKMTADGPTVAGTPLHLSVVGVYRPRDPTERYWATTTYFAPSVGIFQPVFGELHTLDSLTSAIRQHDQVDAVLRPDALSPATFGALTTTLASLTRRQPGSDVLIGTGIPALLAAIDADRARLRQLVPLIAVPLIALGCFVMFLIVSYGVQDRRTEIGVVKLRGVPSIARWTLGVGESLVPVVAGVLVGVATGALLARALAAATLTDTGGVLAGAVTLGPAAAALVGLLVAVFAAHRRTLREPVVAVLRRVPARSGAWRSAVVEVLLVALAVAAVADLRSQTGTLAGITLATPGLVIAAVAVLVARLLPPITVRLGDAFLGVRSGRRRRASLSAGLGALALARRPGAHRLLVVQIVAVGLCGYAVIASSVGVQARRDQVRASLGADRVLTIASSSVEQLVQAVRGADPSGRYAMAVIPIRPELTSDPPMLAVDSGRLAAVAAWPDDAGVSAARAAAALRPAAPARTTVKASRMAIRIAADSLDSAGEPLRLRITVAPLDGSPPATVDMGFLRAGDHTYPAAVPECVAGCQLVGVHIDQPQQVPYTVDVTIEEVRTLAPTSAPVAVHLDDATAWRANLVLGQSQPPTVTATSTGLRATLTLKLSGNAIDLSVIRVPYPLPIVAAGTVRHTLWGISTENEAVQPVASVRDLPRVGTFGALVDLDYATAVASPGAVVDSSEVWLAPGAPASVVAAITAAGLRINTDVRAKARSGQLDKQGPAVGARAGLVLGAGGPLLAVACLLAMAGIDRRDRAAEFRTLRVQGLPAAVVRRASLIGQFTLVLAGATVGAVAALAAWWLTGTRVPLFVLGGGAPLLMPTWPAVVVPAAVVAALVMLAASGTVVDTVRLTRRAAAPPRSQWESGL